jgi:carbamoyl-phosphate synthase large subunit
VPYLSKITGIPMVKVATRCIMGEALADMGFPEGLYPEQKNPAVKAPVFSFQKLVGVDNALGPEMKSTGEVLGQDVTYPGALYKAMVGAGLRLPITGTVLFTVANADKEEALPIAREFATMGYALQATAGTAAYFAANGLNVETVAKITESEDNLVTRIHSGQVGLVVNTLSKDKRIEEEGQLIRRATVERSVPCMTSLDTAAALLLALKARAEGTFGVMTVDEYLLA